MVSRSVLVAVSGFLFLGPQIIHAEVKNPVVAEINEKAITLEDFKKKYEQNLRFFPIKPPSKEAVPNDLVKRELGIQEAKRLGLDQDPEVKERINTVLFHALLEKKLPNDSKALQISDKEAKEYYEKNPEIRTSHIFIALAENAGPLAQEKAYQKIKHIYNNYVAPKKLGFIETAQKFSEDSSSALGGDLDFQTRGKLDPTYYEAALKLKKPGEISPIVRSKFGYHIIKLTAIRSWKEVDKARIQRELFDSQRTALFEKYIQGIKDKSKVSVHWDLLSKPESTNIN